MEIGDAILHYLLNMLFDNMARYEISPGFLLPCLACFVEILTILLIHSKLGKV